MSRVVSIHGLWLMAYLAMLAGVTWGMFDARERMLAVLDTPQARAEWEAWRAQVREEVERGGPVERRVPPSPEPNLLVLLRDYFAVCLAAALFFTSLLFLVLMILLRGAFSGQSVSGSNPDLSGPEDGEEAGLRRR